MAIAEKTSYLELINPIVSIGADPEIFLTDEDGNIVPSTEVIPKGDGLKHLLYGKVVQDGIQVELNPMANSCRQMTAYYISTCFTLLQQELDKRALEGKKYSISKLSVVKLSKEQMKALPEKVLELGCKPSLNLYDSEAKVGVEGAKYPYRSGAGHVHLGDLPRTIFFNAKKDYDPYVKTSVDRRAELVQLLDIIVGNTCVLIDRDPLQVERRKHYGRAGEFRLPNHGLEYRTLSNFWLRDYALASFVFGMSRYAVMILHSSHKKLHTTSDFKQHSVDLSRELIESVDVDKVRTAIDTNDAELAMETFKILKKFIVKYHRWMSDKVSVKDMPLSPMNMAAFGRFITDVETRGLDTIFPNSILEAWVKRGWNDVPTAIDTTSEDSGAMGWERFLKTHYRADSVKKV